MRRRDLFAAGGALLMPTAARAQPAQLPPLVGVVRVNMGATDRFPAGFRRDMAQLGWEEGRTVRYRFLFAEQDAARVPGLYQQLLAEKPALLVSSGNPGTRSAQQAAHGLPIVGITDDWVGGGLVASMARPGGNTTGVSTMGRELDEKRLEILLAAVPGARRLGVLFDPDQEKSGEPSLPKVERAAAARGLAVAAAPLGVPDQLDPAFAALKASGVEAVCVLASPFLYALRGRLVDRLRAERWPAIHQWPDVVEQGGLLAYGPSFEEVYRHAAVLVSKVLRGVRPADLPIEQPTVFTLAVNPRAAREIGLQLPADMMQRADLVVD
jgi:putative tryptophan/tyrosine transport system substrate-binding protein